MEYESARIAELTDREIFATLHESSRKEIEDHKGADLWQRTSALKGASLEIFDEVSQSEEFICVLGMYNDYPFGFLIAEWVSIYERRSINIREVFVASEMRSVGVGEAMMDYLLSEAERSSAISILGRALPGDRDLKNFFERFKITARVIEVERKL